MSRLSVSDLPFKFQNQIAAQMGHAAVYPSVKVAPAYPAPLRKKRGPMNSAALTLRALQFFEDRGLPAPVLEHRFDSIRKWRFDIAYPKFKTAVEIEGGLFVNGGHSRGAGRIKDMEKFNAATVQGWSVLHVQPKELCTESTVEMIKALLALNA